MTDSKKRDKFGPKQWEIWFFDPDPVKGNEIRKKNRPAVIISCNTFNEGPSELIIVVPMTSKNKQIPSHILIDPSDTNGDLKLPSFAICEQIRSITKERLIKKIGNILNPYKIQRIHGWILDLIWIEDERTL